MTVWQVMRLTQFCHSSLWYMCFAPPSNPSCSTAWSGLYTAGDRARLNRFLCRGAKLGYRERTAPLVEHIFATCDEQLFSQTNCNSLHILQQFLPECTSLSYSFRPRSHNKTLTTKSTQLNDHDFLISSIYKDLYWLWQQSSLGAPPQIWCLFSRTCSAE